MAMAYVLKIRFASAPDRTCFGFQRVVLNSDIRDDSEFCEKKISIGYILYMNNTFCRRIYCLIARLNVKRQLTRKSLRYNILCIQLFRGAICKWAPKLIMVNRLHLLLTYLFDA